MRRDGFLHRQDLFDSLHTIRAWHQPLTVPVYLVFALATGATLLTAIATLFGRFQPFQVILGVAALLLAMLLKFLYWRAIDAMPRGPIRWTTPPASAASETSRQWEVPHTSENYIQKEMGYAVARKHAAKLRKLVFLLLAAAILLMLLALLAPVVSLLAVIAALSAAVVERWLFFAEAQHVVTLFYGAEAGLMLGKGVRWFDDWFAIEQVAPGVTAIGEPRFHQLNWNYLIEGNRRALLLDTGPGVRDIAKVVRALTNLPVTALPSHMHFDHTGGLAALRQHRHRRPAGAAQLRRGWMAAPDRRSLCGLLGGHDLDAGEGQPVA